MGAHASKEKLTRSTSERYVHSKYIEQERFGRFGKRARGLSARKRSSIQNELTDNEVQSTEPPIKPVALYKRLTYKNEQLPSERRINNKAKKSSPANQAVVHNSANKISHAKELSSQTTITNNNNSSINNNNTNGTKNSYKLLSNDDHPINTKIEQNAKNVETGKSKELSKIQSKTDNVSAVNGESNENLIEFSICGSGEKKTTNSISTQTLHSNQQPDVAQANKTIVALSILIQHLTINLKAFETPSLRAALKNSNDELLETRNQLDAMRIKCNHLNEQLLANENVYANQRQTLIEANDRELEKLKLCLLETEKAAKDQIQNLERQLINISEEHAESLKLYEIKANEKFNELERKLQLVQNSEAELLQRLKDCTATENQLRDKVQASEQEFAQRLIAASTRERELNDKCSQLMRQLDAEGDQRRKLEERLKLAYDENIDSLRQRNNYIELKGSNTPPLVKKSMSAMLEEEVLSLRSVLEMKLNEISELRKQNESMVTAQNELPRTQLKLSTLESRLEDLSIQLKSKAEDEQELAVKNRSLQEMLNQEIKNRTRLTLHNEELQWKLKQNSEKYSNTLMELSKSYHDPALMLSDFKNGLYAPISEGQYKIDGVQLSPPSSPVVKGVVEKCDSVSYVLELNDDNSAETIANRMVRRAGSFRSKELKERSQSFKRQISICGVNTLTQSASAASILRSHSDSPAKHIGQLTKNRSVRHRSNSLSATNEPKNPCDITTIEYRKWQESMNIMSTSSPTNLRPLKKNGDLNGLNRWKSNERQSLDTNEQTFCDTPHIKRHNVNQLKKRQIKASAGEAMVSQQSEDDHSSASEMESSTSSSVSPSHSDVHHMQMSMDEEAFMNKIVASLTTRTTPMDVSWSEDGDNELYDQESSA